MPGAEHIEHIAETLQPKTNENEKISGYCGICKTSCETKCSNCKKAFYCSVDCQRTDRKSHKAECFPAELITDTNDNYNVESSWIATRDIQEGEIIFSEYPLVVGPSDKVPSQYTALGLSHIPVCLACLKVLESGSFNKCSKCSWPVCNKTCENNPQHGEAECRIFTAKKLGSTNNMEEYNMVSVLRCILFKSTNPRKWSQLMKLHPKKDTTVKTETERKMEEIESQCQIEFFNDILGPGFVSAPEAAQVTNAWKTLQVHPLPGLKTHCQSILFYNFNFISHSCLPNTKSIEVNTGSNKFNTIATTKIPKGSKITFSILYGNCMDGTRARRSTLNKLNGFECKCARCKDPTELGTFMSAIKCPGLKGKGHGDSELNQNLGYLLPIEPLNDDSMWKCNYSRCDLSFTSEQISKILAPVWSNVCTLLKRADDRKFETVRRNDATPEDYQLICEMENYLDKLDKILHPNHYFKFSLVKKILPGMSACIQPLEENPQVVFRTHRLEIAERMQELATFCSKLSEIILPGLSLFTGKTLYFLAISKWIWIIENLTNGGSVEKTIDEMKSTVELNRRVEKIFKGDAPDSTETLLAEHLKVLENIAKGLFASNPAFISRMN